jgi:3-methyladenine DNA glycosylase/8-oxoguanine DNA glycosylase
VAEPTGRRGTTPAEAAQELARRDPVIAALLARHGPPRLSRPGPASTRFAALARSIVYQQLNGRAAATIHGRLVSALDGALTPEAVLGADEEVLRAAGLSRSKAAAVTDLAAKVAAGTVRLERIGRLPDEEVVAELVKVRGVGRWTAEMFLMFTLGRLDVWPTGDYGVRMGFARAWGLPEPPTPEVLAALGDPFRPYRSVAAWYCWRAVEQPLEQS